MEQPWFSPRGSCSAERAAVAVGEGPARLLPRLPGSCYLPQVLRIAIRLDFSLSGKLCARARARLCPCVWVGWREDVCPCVCQFPDEQKSDLLGSAENNEVSRVHCVCVGCLCVSVSMRWWRCLSISYIVVSLYGRVCKRCPLDKEFGGGHRSRTKMPFLCIPFRSPNKGLEIQTRVSAEPRADPERPNRCRKGPARVTG